MRLQSGAPYDLGRPYPGRGGLSEVGKEKGKSNAVGYLDFLSSPAWVKKARVKSHKARCSKIAAAAKHDRRRSYLNLFSCGLMLTSFLHGVRNKISSGLHTLELFREPELMQTHSTGTYKQFGAWELFGSQGPQMTDVNQGKAGDCYFLAALSSVAGANQTAVADMIRDRGDGTYSVRFFLEYSDGSHRPVWTQVDSLLAHDQDGQLLYTWIKGMKTSSPPVIWAPLVEKAFAKFNDRYQVVSGKQGFEGIGKGGTLYQGLVALTGKKTEYRFTRNISLPELKSICEKASSQSAVTVGTGMNPIQEDIVAGHAYSVAGIVDQKSTTYVVLRNPWGYINVGGHPQDAGFFSVPLHELSRLFPLIAYASLAD